MPKSTAVTGWDEPTIDQLSDMSYEELLGLMDSGQLVHVAEIGFRMPIEKEALVGIPFVITNWVSKLGDMGSYVRVEIVTRGGDKRFFSDGSTGIRDQLEFALNKLGGVIRPVYVPNGLRASNYVYHNPDTGEHLPATTYYLNLES